MSVEQISKKREEKKAALQKFSCTFEKHPYLICILTAVILNSIIEIYSRHSFAEYFEYIAQSPFAVIYSVMIITLTLFASLLFSKRVFIYLLMTIVWLALGIANGTVLLFRVTPLTGVDFTIIWSVLGIIEIYLKPWQMILISCGIVLTLALLVFMAIRTPRLKVMFRKGALSLFTLGLALVVATSVGLEAGAISDEFPNLADAYDEYGFAYCFARSVLDTGIKEPDDYDETISDIKNSIENDLVQENEAADNRSPNVVLLQLESFFDTSYMTEYELSEDAVPNFRRLKENYPHGYLTVPAVGAGTANTEFEVLTGMSLDFFGTCEYPYKTVLNDTATSSICTDLKANGYIAHAMHNNTGTFYDRDTVYSYLGFDAFTPLEYMLTPAYNELGWAKDSVLTGEILRALDSTDERDFVFAVSVQAHGKYPREDIAGEISVTGGSDEELANAAEYYVNQIREVDRFIGELTKALENYKEPVVLVMYGDHLPSLELEDENLSTGSVFKTEYVLWSNCDVEAESRDLSSWQLAPYIMETLGLDGGPVTTLHLTEGDSEDFYEKLEALEYDMLYGDFALFDGVNPYEPSDMKMGSCPVQVTGVFEEEGNLYVKGKNFTRFSRVCIDGNEEETVFIDRFTLMVKDKKVSDGNEFCVAQVTDSGVALGFSDVLQK